MSVLGLGCKNAKTLNHDRRSYSSKTASVAQLASEFNLEIELKKIILVTFRFFEFLHSQGQNQKSGDAIATSDLPLKPDIKRPSPEIRKVPICDIAQNECSEARVAAIVNMSPAMVHHYCKKVGQFRLARAAISGLGSRPPRGSPTLFDRALGSAGATHSCG
jgi:hypothetical protein